MWIEVGRVKADIQKLNIKDLQVSDYFKIEWLIVDHIWIENKNCHLMLIFIIVLSD